MPALDFVLNQVSLLQMAEGSTEIFQEMSFYKYLYFLKKQCAGPVSLVSETNSGNSEKKTLCLQSACVCARACLCLKALKCSCHGNTSCLSTVLPWCLQWLLLHRTSLERGQTCHSSENCTLLTVILTLSLVLFLCGPQRSQKRVGDTSANRSFPSSCVVLPHITVGVQMNFDRKYWIQDLISVLSTAYCKAQ